MPLFSPGEFHGQRSLAEYSPLGRKDMTERLTHRQLQWDGSLSFDMKILENYALVYNNSFNMLLSSDKHFPVVVSSSLSLNPLPFSLPLSSRIHPSSFFLSLLVLCLSVYICVCTNKAQIFISDFYGFRMQHKFPKFTENSKDQKECCFTY